MKSHRIAMSILFFYLPFAFACTSAIYKGSNGIVRYQEFKRHADSPTLELVIVQETHENADRMLSERKTNAYLKKAPIDEYAYLIRTFVEDCDFLGAVRSVESGISSGSYGVGGAYRAISVENEYGKWTLRSDHCVCQYDGCPKNYPFMPYIEAFRNCFDNIFSLRLLEDEEKGGPEFFRQEQERLEKIGQD